ncbi:MAG: MlaA family lipoprotein, partial [Burkholderiales bacterium]
PYAFVRDAYLQRRRNLVYDGKPPLDDDDPDPEAEPKPGASKPEEPAGKPAKPDAPGSAAKP